MLYVYFGNEKGFRLQCSFTVADEAKQNIKKNLAVIVKFKEIISSKDKIYRQLPHHYNIVKENTGIAVK